MYSFNALSSFVPTSDPGAVSLPMRIGCIAAEEMMDRPLFKACNASSLSVSAVSQFGLIRGGSSIEFDSSVILPRETGLTGIIIKVP